MPRLTSSCLPQCDANLFVESSNRNEPARTAVQNQAGILLAVPTDMVVCRVTFRHAALPMCAATDQSWFAGAAALLTRMCTPPL